MLTLKSPLKGLNCISSTGPSTGTASSQPEHRHKSKASAPGIADVDAEKHVAESKVPPVYSGATAILTCIIEKGDNDMKINATKLLRRIESLFDPASCDSLDDQRWLDCRVTLTEELQMINDTIVVVHGSRNQHTLETGTAALYLAALQQTLFEYDLSMMECLRACNLQSHQNAEDQSLDWLDRAKDAGFKSDNSRSSCLKGTRTEVLHTLQAWATDPNAKQIFWLDSHAGSGKSAISQSFAEWLSSEGKLGASFFCSKSRSQERGDLRAILPSIAYQIAHSTNTASPKFWEILHKLCTSWDICWNLKSLPDQFKNLLVDPVAQSGISTVVVIDGLDECNDNDFNSYYPGHHYYTFLSNLARSIEHVPTVKFLITSRPDTCIDTGFSLPQLQSATERLSLHNVDYTSVSDDIRILFQAKLKDVFDYPRVAYKFQVPSGWPSSSDIDALVKKADGLFAFADAAIGCISSRVHDPRERMRMLLADADGSKYEGSESNGKLDALYRELLEHEFGSIRSPECFSRLRSILSLLFVVYRRGRMGFGEVFETSLQSVLLVPEEAEGIVKVHHRAFLDFVVDEKRCTDKRFHVSAEEVAKSREKARGVASM